MGWMVVPAAVLPITCPPLYVTGGAKPEGGGSLPVTACIGDCHDDVGPPLASGGRRLATTGAGPGVPGTLAGRVVAAPAVPAVSDVARLAGWVALASSSRTAAAMGNAMRAPRPPQRVRLTDFIVAPLCP